MTRTMTEPFRSQQTETESEQQREGTVAKNIERHTAKLPSDVFLWSAGAAIIGSCVLQMTGNQKASLFVGQWVAPTLILGLYNKLVKVAGSDRSEQSGEGEYNLRSEMF